MIQPLILTPITDWIYNTMYPSPLLSNNYLHARIMTQYMECVDAYGAEASRYKCLDLLMDLGESRTPYKQLYRAAEMRKQRRWQYFFSWFGGKPMPECDAPGELIHPLR